MLPPKCSRLILTVTLGVFGLTLAGCAIFPTAPVTTAHTGEVHRQPGEVVTEENLCAATWDGLEPIWELDSTSGVLPSGFVPVQGVWCRTTTGSEYSDGQAVTVTVQRTTNTAPLVAQSTVADESVPAGSYECAAQHILDSFPPRVWLTDDEGRSVQIRIPRTLCGDDMTGIREAFPQEDL